MSEKTIATKSRGIIFSAPMVRAILDGTKTQARRVVGLSNSHCEDCSEPRTVWDDGLKPWTDPATGYPHDADDPRWLWQPANVLETCCGCGGPFWKCPYGNPGDTLWVRETCFISASRDEVVRREHENYEAFRADKDRYKVTSSIHMPRWASRITLEITGVRVDRLCDISEADAIAEGLPSKLVNDPLFKPDAREYWSPLGWCMTPEIAYEALWDSLNRSRAPWSSNPWVWVISFKRLPEVPDAR